METLEQVAGIEEQKAPARTASAAKEWGAFAVKTDPASPADWLRIAADRRERRGEPVTALLFRNEAYRLENGD
jgi:hypothetical protein